MDLPVTDPGSDLYDLTDSADEGATRLEGGEASSTIVTSEINWPLEVTSWRPPHFRSVPMLDSVPSF